MGSSSTWAWLLLDEELDDELEELLEDELLLDELFVEPPPPPPPPQAVIATDPNRVMANAMCFMLSPFHSMVGT